MKDSSFPSMPQIELLFTANSRFVPGAVVSIGSALDFAAPMRAIHVHIIDTGLSTNDRSLLENLVLLRPLTCVSFHSVDFSPIRGAQEYFSGGLAPYARLFFATTIPTATRLLYFDTDMLILRDCTELFDLDLGKNTAAMVRELGAPSLSFDCPFSSNENINAFHYFNSGTFLVDAEAWRTGDYEKKAIALINKQPQKLRFWDQTVLNYLLRGKILELDQYWNARVNHPLPGVDAVYHYANGRKPWNSYPYRQIDDLWHLYWSERVKKRFNLKPPRKPLTSIVKGLSFECLRYASRFARNKSAEQWIPSASLRQKYSAWLVARHGMPRQVVIDAMSDLQSRLSRFS